MSRRSLYEKTKRWLRREYPLPFRCRVILRPPERMQGMHGQFCWHGSSAVIWICRRVDDEQMSETLIEEWVHAIRHAAPLAVDYDGEAHDATFWALYGQVITRWRKEPL